MELSAWLDTWRKTAPLRGVLYVLIAEDACIYQTWRQLLAFWQQYLICVNKTALSEVLKMKPVREECVGLCLAPGGGLQK